MKKKKAEMKKIEMIWTYLLVLFFQQIFLFISVLTANILCFELKGWKGFSRWIEKSWEDRKGRTIINKNGLWIRWLWNTKQIVKKSWEKFIQTEFTRYFLFCVTITHRKIVQHVGEGNCWFSNWVLVLFQICFHQLRKDLFLIDLTLFRIAKRPLDFLVAVWDRLTSKTTFGGRWSSVLNILEKLASSRSCHTFPLWFQTRFDLLFVRYDQSLRANVVFHLTATLAQDSSLIAHLAFDLKTERAV